VTDHDAIPPNDEDAERVVLAGLLRQWAAVWREVRRAGLRRGDLYHHRHLLVWDAAAGLGASGRPVSAVEVWREVGRRGHWGEWPQWGRDRTGRLGCAAWLVELLDVDPTGYWALEKAVRVRDLAARRRVIHRARQAIRDAIDGVPVNELLGA
jgi:replicative DNA helicase